MTMKLTASGGVLAALAAISVAFNRWIDGREVESPGETSVQVVVGTGYTLLAVALLVWLWRGWRESLRLVVCAGACFAAAGAPMVAGDVRRDRR